MSRRARQIRELKRNSPKLASYDRVLIVCEGSKTEPNYFRELVDHLKLNTANVEVDGESDSSPRSVVAHAIKRYQDDDEFDQIYCVFDQREPKDISPAPREAEYCYRAFKTYLGAMRKEPE